MSSSNQGANMSEWTLKGPGECRPIHVGPQVCTTARCLNRELRELVVLIREANEMSVECDHVAHGVFFGNMPAETGQSAPHSEDGGALAAVGEATANVQIILENLGRTCAFLKSHMVDDK